MHLKRWLTAIIGIPAVLFLLGPAPRPIFYVFLFFLAFAGLKEFYGMAASGLPRFVEWGSYFLVLLLFLTIYLRQVLLAPFIIALWAFVPMTYFMFTNPSQGLQGTAVVGRAVLGPLYVALPVAMLLHIDRFVPNGHIWIFFLCAVIFANDTGAFYFGKAFGKHKLYEAVSPKKTWEGAFGGLLTGLIAGIFFLRILRFCELTIETVAFVVALSLAGQIGDLVESMFKRNHGVKDSGKILPGHGGVLDRIDGILFSIPLLYMYLSLRII